MSWTRFMQENGFDLKDMQDMVEQLRADFRAGTIDEKGFRRQMARFGYSATEIDSEVRENEP